MVSEKDNSADKKREGEELRKYFFLVVRKWYWVISSIVLCLIIAWLINRYTTKTYNIETTILSKKYERQNARNAFDAIQGDEYFTTIKDINMETTVLKSYPVISEAIRRLKWNISYYKKGRIKTTELYRGIPIELNFDQNSQKIPVELEFTCRLINPSEYELSVENEQWLSFIEGVKFAFNDTVNLNGFVFILKNQSPNYYKEENPEIVFKINNVERIIRGYQSKMKIDWVAMGSAVLRLSLSSQNVTKDIDFLKSLSDVIVEKSITDKNGQAIKTINFIDQQLVKLADSMRVLSISMQNLVLLNRDLSTGSNQIFQKINDLEEEKYELILANQYLDYLEGYVKGNSEHEVIAPVTVGLNESLLDNLIFKYVDLQMEQKVKGDKLVDKSPIFRIEQEDDVEMMEELEKNISESIDNIRKANEISIEEIDKKVDELLNSVEDLLSEELQYTNFERIFSLNENFYTLLLSKKVEAAIAKASQESDYEVLDFPRAIGEPIVPKIRKNYMLALIFGAGIPIGIIILLNYLNPYIITIEDLRKYSQLPLLGIVGHSNREDILIVKSNPKSRLAESFRKLRANLKYLSNEQSRENTILITSSVSGEGKTFNSINLGYIYALSGKKTLLLGADMRKPAFDKFFELRQEEGLSNYLADVCKYEKLLHKVLLEDLYVIHSGTIPPNPSELLLTGRMTELMERLKKDFDIIIIDSPPIGLVSDTIELLKYSDVNLIIVRQRKTHKEALSGINHLYLEDKLGKCAVVYNDIHYSKLSYSYNYGYGYGYGYGYRNDNGTGYYDEEHTENGSLLKRLLPGND